MGTVADIEAGDLDGDGDRDLVVASNQGDYWGHFDIYRNDGSGNFTWRSRYLAKAGVNDVAVVEMLNDGLSRPDILVGVSEAQSAGGVQVWYNKLTGFGMPDSSGFVYDADTQPKVPDTYFNANGEALAVGTARLDADIYPEVVVGTRSSLFYTGDLFVVSAKDGSAVNVKTNIAGEVVTVDFADFNKDTKTDIVVTTRVSQTSGKLAIYFLDDVSVIP
jgi:hypothetical protein